MNTQAVLGRLASVVSEESKESKVAKKDFTRARRIKRRREAEDVAKRDSATEMIFIQNREIKQLQRDLERSGRKLKKTCNEANQLRARLITAENEIARLKGLSERSTATTSCEVFPPFPVSSSQEISAIPLWPSAEEVIATAEQHLLSFGPLVSLAPAPATGLFCRNLFKDTHLPQPPAAPTWESYYGYRQA
jgi:hypothetical protein